MLALRSECGLRGEDLLQDQHMLLLGKLLVISGKEVRLRDCGLTVVSAVPANTLHINKKSWRTDAISSAVRRMETLKL